MTTIDALDCLQRGILCFADGRVRTADIPDACKAVDTADGHELIGWLVYRERAA